MEVHDNFKDEEVEEEERPLVEEEEDKEGSSVRACARGCGARYPRSYNKVARGAFVANLDRMSTHGTCT